MRINIELCCFVGESGLGNNTSLYLFELVYFGVW